MVSLEEIERNLEKIERLEKLDERTRSDIMEIVSRVASLVGAKQSERERAVQDLKENKEAVKRELNGLLIDQMVMMQEGGRPADRRRIREELDKLEMHRRFIEIEERMKRLRKEDPDLARYVSDLLAMRVYPHRPKPPYNRPYTSPPYFNNKLTKPSKNPAYMLDSYLLDKVGKHFGPVLYVVPAFSLETEFAKHGHVLAITPSENYLPEASERILPLKKKAQELTRKEINQIKQRVGTSKTVLVIKGINSILNEKDMKKLIETVDPDAIVVYGTYHEARPNFEGVPSIDKKTISLIKEKNFEEITDRVFTREELNRIKQIEKRINNLIDPWAKYFPATRVKVFRRRPR